MRRALSATILSAAVLATSAVALSTTGPARAADTPRQLYGTQLHTMWDTPNRAGADAQLDLLAGLHADTGRLDVSWASLQENDAADYSQWYVDRLDYNVADAYARGVRLVITLADTPCWASSAPDTLKQGCTGAWWDRNVQKWAPTDPADLGRAAAWVAQRYAGRIAAIEVWNEPNYDDGSLVNLVAPDKAKTYAAMVEAVYPAVKAVAPSLPVLAGALSYSDTTFLGAAFAAGMRHFDGISVHPYTDGHAPDAAPDPGWLKVSFSHGLPALHDAIVAAGFPNTPVWITEVGWTSCQVGSGYTCVSTDDQAAYLAQAMQIAAQWPWVGAVIAYELRDNGGGSATDPEQNFGVVRNDLSRKPAYDALRTAIDAARAATTPVVTDPTPIPTATATPTPTPSTTTAPLRGVLKKVRLPKRFRWAVSHPGQVNRATLRWRVRAQR